ncbi:Coq4 family protein [Nodularia chucula]|uniref:Coq4 family protein n=1 Tax=Nodularia chucula TaxID=3093667 RepID=UPI0039C6F9E5
MIICKKLKQLREILADKNSNRLGDFAILKSDLLGAKVSPEIASQLAAVVGYYPLIDLKKLSQYPQDTFGREYADHMKANHLQALNISSELEEIAKNNVFALRYAITHDIFHVLLGFDTSYAGEIGVLAFASAQNYSQSLKISLWFAKFLYPLLAPQQIKQIFANLKKGKELGKKAEFMLGYRFEEHWEDNIADLQHRLGLPVSKNG